MLPAPAPFRRPWGRPRAQNPHVRLLVSRIIPRDSTAVARGAARIHIRRFWGKTGVSCKKGRVFW